jgi:type IV secretory pathway VirD2 relaxase
MRSFERQIMHAVAKAGGDPRRIGKGRLSAAKGKARNGRFNARGRGAKVMRTLPRDTGWSFDKATGMRMRMRRVVVKARFVKLKGPGSRASYAHLRYLQRDGVSRDGEGGEVYGRLLDRPDGPAFLERSAEDKHQFRFIVAPEDGVELGDLRRFTRELMDKMEQDLETNLDWLAIDHHNTGHPHTHIVVRGVTDDGKALYIAGDYIAHGIRHRASEILSRELGLQSERDVEQQLDTEVDQERFTRLDRNLIAQAGDERVIDLRPEPSQDGLAGDAQRYRLLKRLKKLERLGLAEETDTGFWSVSAKTESSLRAMGERGDIIKTIHRTIAERGIDRAVDRYVIHHGPRQETVAVGRVIGKGLSADEMSDRIHIVVDGLDGRVHYAEMQEREAEGVKVGSIVEVGRAVARPRESDSNIAELARTAGGTYQPAIHLSIVNEMQHVPGGDRAEYVRAHVRRLEALRRGGIVERIDAQTWSIPNDYLARARAYDTQRAKQLGVRVLSSIDIEAQVTANGATWLDKEIISSHRTPMWDSGFGSEARQAMARRQQWLIEQGLIQREAGMIVFRANLLATLAKREVAAKGQELAAKHGSSFHIPEHGERITGRYKGAVELVSGKYALIERSRDFTLVPWRPFIERELGRTISGIVRGDGISWEVGRSRGPTIGM